MRLSEAIKLGAMLKPQGFGDYQTRNGGACALGSAMDAVGVETDIQNSLTDLLLGQLLPATNTSAACPVKPCNDDFAREIGSVIVHLNDDHRWTREQIADWVATVEPQETSAPAMELPASVNAVDPVEGLVAMVHAR